MLMILAGLRAFPALQGRAMHKKTGKKNGKKTGMPLVRVKGTET
jgi:hypothetical protein